MISLLLKAANTIAAPMAGRGRFFLDSNGTPSVRKPDGTLLQFAAGGATSEQLEEVAAVAAGALSNAQGAQQTASQASNDAVEAINMVRGLHEWDLPGMLKGTGATRAAGAGGDYTVGAELRALSARPIRGVRLWWPKNEAADITASIYRTTGGVVCTETRNFAADEVADIIFPSPMTVAAGEVIMVCMWANGSSGHSTMTTTPFWPWATSLEVNGFYHVPGLMKYIAGDGKPNASAGEQERAAFWPIL